MERFLFNQSKYGGLRHLVYTIYGGDYFFGETRDLWLIGSNKNGACHGIRKIKLFNITGHKLHKIYIWTYNKFYKTKLHRLAMYAFSKI